MGKKNKKYIFELKNVSFKDVDFAYLINSKEDLFYKTKYTFPFYKDFKFIVDLLYYTAYKYNKTNVKYVEIGFNTNKLKKLNYGYIPNVIGGDNEEQDAYIIDSSLNVSVSNYIGKLIAIVYRKDDNKTKWIISNESFSETEIYERISFIEKYFDSEVILC